MGAEGGATAECAVKQESTVGPFPNLGPFERKDVRGNTSGATEPKPGAPLTLRVRVLDRDAGCTPLAGAVVEVWQCDAVGAYAGYATFNTVGQDFCRGAQQTDAQGFAEFLTIFPGSYSGRALHIHFAIRSSAGTLPANGSGQDIPDKFVSQMYFEADVAADVFAAYPLYQRGAAITPNEADAFYVSGGPDLIVDVAKSGDAYIGVITIAVSRAEVGL